MESDATPMNDEIDSETLLEGQQSSSVFDFLYQDVRRVASFLAQFEEHGVRSSVKASESAGRSETTKTTATASLGVPAIAGAIGVLDINTSEDTRDLAEHSFDPLWANSRRLLDYLETNDLITSDIWSTTIGRFIVIEGTISIIDTASVNAIYNNKDLKKAFVDRLFVNEDKTATRTKKDEIRQDLEAVMQLPSNIQMFVFGDNFRAWSSLTNESLVTSAADLALKHGSMLRGHWKVLGVLDAVIDEKPHPSEEYPDPHTLDELGPEMITAPIAQIAARMANVARTSLGRPRDYFGITPLLIFRTVSGE